jgi:hypothetical protein
MTEEQKRAIYEWCPELQGKPLDMNTWHGPVEARLAAKGIRVDVVCLSVDGKPLRNAVLSDEDIDSHTAFHNWYGNGATAEAASYAALLQYIEAVRQ